MFVPFSLRPRFSQPNQPVFIFTATLLFIALASSSDVHGGVISVVVTAGGTTKTTSAGPIKAEETFTVDGLVDRYASAFAGAGENWRSALRSQIVVQDRPIIEAGAGRRIAGSTFSSLQDTIVWRGLGPAPGTLNLKMTFSGSFSGRLYNDRAFVLNGDGELEQFEYDFPTNPARVTGGFVARVNDQLAGNQDVLVLGASGSVTASGVTPGGVATNMGEFSDFGFASLRKSNFSDSYQFSLTLTGNALADQGFMTASSTNSFGLLDVQLADGTSVIDQIEFESGIPLTSAATVPEPSSFAVFGLGIAGFAMIRRRRSLRKG